MTTEIFEGGDIIINVDMRRGSEPQECFSNASMDGEINRTMLPEVSFSDITASTFIEPLYRPVLTPKRTGG
jgi:hypothetical protein